MEATDSSVCMRESNWDSYVLTARELKLVQSLHTGLDSYSGAKIFIGAIWAAMVPIEAISLATQAPARAAQKAVPRS